MIGHKTLLLAAVYVFCSVSGHTPEECTRCDFRCDDDIMPACIEKKQICDGVSDCKSGIDESVKLCGCPDGEFRCKDNVTCLDNERVCDRRNDCLDNPNENEGDTDELDCESHICPPEYSQCDNGYCIPKTWWCDFVDDCGDSSDESTCVRPECTGAESQCANHQCIYDAYFCDGKPDCLDGSDEIDCDATRFRCPDTFYIKNSRLCDRFPDCEDHSDELQCSCTETEYVCANTRCIRQAHVCDGVCDCLDSCDDEDNCGSAHVCSRPGDYLCVSAGVGHPQRCIAAEYVCDNQTDCLFHDDETVCSFCEETQFKCPISGRCIPGDYRCDGVGDCYLQKDETNCFEYDVCTAGEFRCASGQCINETLVCDTTYDCEDRSDERECDTFDCPEGFPRCLSSGQCVSPSKWCDYDRNCPDGSDERNCTNIYRKCKEDEFQCRSGECIPADMECVLGDGGCKDLSHIWGNCRNKTCSAGYYKCPNSHCIGEAKVGDGVADCLKTGFDENEISNTCQSNIPECKCFDTRMDCSNASLEQVPALFVAMRFELYHIMNFSYNKINLTACEFNYMNPSVRYIDLSHNGIKEVPDGVFYGLVHLISLSLAYNEIETINKGAFRGLINLKNLHLDGNFISSIEPRSFLSLKKLIQLSLRGQNLNGTLLPGTFMGLESVTKLDLSDNFVKDIPDGAFQGLTRLQRLYITNNSIKDMESKVFFGLTQLTHVETDEYRFCCVAGHRNFSCTPASDPFSSCEDLLANGAQRITIWVMGLVALIGNVVVIIWRLQDKRSSKIHSFLITNLACADFFMGVYLLIVAAVDAYHRGVYIKSDSIWRQSGLCKFAGFLTLFSSELSVFTLTVITLDRFISITFPFKLSRLGMRKARITMISLWILSVLLSGIPLMDVNYFQMFYGRSGVCLALPISSETHKSHGWEYSFTVTIVLNLVSFLTILVSYIWMFAMARHTQGAVRTPEMKCDNAMARRMTVIVMTDFCCWMPIIFMGVLSRCGVSLSSEVYAWTAVFVLPLNSAVNPVLYTLSTPHFVGNVIKRVQEIRIHTGETKSTSAEEEREFIRIRRYTMSDNRHRAHDEMRMRSLSAPPLRGKAKARNGTDVFGGGRNETAPFYGRRTLESTSSNECCTRSHLVLEMNE